MIDSFYVDFDYLARNTAINGNALAMAALGPVTPGFTADTLTGNKIRVTILNENHFLQYRVAIRTLTNDWDSVYFMINKQVDTINLCHTGTYYVSVATMDFNGVESLFSNEVTARLNSVGACLASGVDELTETVAGIELLQNKPNPFDEATTISVYVDRNPVSENAYICITDFTGRKVKQIPIMLKPGINEVTFEHGFNAIGIYFYTLYIDDKPVQTRKMVFGN
jgi:hypothetical protein